MDCDKIELAFSRARFCCAGRHLSRDQRRDNDGASGIQHRALRGRCDSLGHSLRTSVSLLQVARVPVHPGWNYCAKCSGITTCTTRCDQWRPLNFVSANLVFRAYPELTFATCRW